MVIRFARAPVPCVMAHFGKKASILHGRVRTCAGEQKDIARVIPIGTRVEPVHAFLATTEPYAIARRRVIIPTCLILTGRLFFRASEDKR